MSSPMSLLEKITPDLKAAMKAKDQVALRSIRAIKAAIILSRTDGSSKELTAEDEIKLVQKLVKQRKESYDIFVKQGREDLAAIEKEEIAVIEKYLPEQMSEEDLKAYVMSVVEKTGAKSMGDMGKVMGIASKELAGKADGKTLASMVKACLG